MLTPEFGPAVFRPWGVIVASIGAADARSHSLMGRGYESSQTKTRVVISILGALFLLSEVSFAANAIEEVVVTAQRTEESVQDVPIAVTAFSGEMMEDKQIISPSDLQLASPNVSFTATNFGGSSFSIRGIGRLVIAGSEWGSSMIRRSAPLPVTAPPTPIAK